MSQAKVTMSQPKDYKLIVEKDVQIPLRDGTLLYGDTSRPSGGMGGHPIGSTLLESRWH